MKTYDPEVQKGILDKMILFYLLFDWSTIKSTVFIGASVQILNYCLVLKSINELKPVEPGVDPSERFKFDVYNSIVFVMAACILQFVKIKSVVTLTIELELTKRQNQTTLQFFERSPHAILLVA